MNISKQLKYYRNQLGLSQEDLAAKIYVSRQTISNWETARSYPDLRSLLLLSELYGVSLDELVKGDVALMKEELRKKNRRMMLLYSYLATAVFILVIGFIAAIPFMEKLVEYHLWLVCGWLLLIVASCSFWSYKMEKLKKQEDLQTYEEVSAFLENRELPDKSQRKPPKSKKKKIMQTVAAMCLGGFIGGGLSYLLAYLFW